MLTCVDLHGHMQCSHSCMSVSSDPPVGMLVTNADNAGNAAGMVLAVLRLVHGKRLHVVCHSIAASRSDMQLCTHPLPFCSVRSSSVAAPCRDMWKVHACPCANLKMPVRAVSTCKAFMIVSHY